VRLWYPLHALTRKGALFQWSADCEDAFEKLRTKLLTSPILAYPNFSLETDVPDQKTEHIARLHIC